MTDESPPMTPTYRTDLSWEENVERGPAFEGPFPVVPQARAVTAKTFLGLPVRSRFGVAAGILGNSRWLSTYARLGFDILTYKTVRSVARRCGTPPNWVWLDPRSTRERIGDEQAAMLVTSQAPASADGRTMGGSFGMPSLPPALWRDDLPRAREALGSGQVLIASVVGTADESTSESAFVADFARLAREVSELGAHVVEANLSCPNVGKREGEVHREPALVGRIARALRDAVPHSPILLKLGEVREAAHADAIVAATAGIVDGLVLANAPARRIVGSDGERFFGAGREQAGVTGAAIKPLALAAIRMAGEAIARRRVRMALVGVGGVVVPGDAREFLDAGACAALSVTGAMLDPLLAIKVKTDLPEV